MRRAYRISKRRHIKTAFSGEGARLAGGRWNSPGRRVVYLSSTLSLAAIEVFVHLGDDAAALDFVYFELDISDSVSVVRASRLPAGWRDEPPGSASMQIGDRWLAAARSALLEVPSVIIPTEANLILNPAHEHARGIRISSPKSFRFDPRMWK